MPGSHLVYVIDDEAELLDATRFLLTSFGIPSRPFRNSEEFLTLVDVLEPGCILTDLRMPGLSGLELQAELLRRGVNWPLIFMSGAREISAVVHAVKKGAVEFLEKPVDELKLLKTLNFAFLELAPGEGTHKGLHEIRAALRTEQIFPHYQPKVSLISGRIEGFEALLRWSPECGDSNRARIIQRAFADNWLENALTTRILDRIFSDMECWREAEVPFGHVSINASPKVLESPAFAENFLARLRSAGISPQYVQVEVTESASLDTEAELVRTSLNMLAGAGVSIALDDFGTGFGSLSHVQSLPVGVIKVDRRFVETFEDLSSASIIKAIVSLCKGLGMQVVAEGVETHRQAEFLQQIGCDTAQGFFFGRAVTAMMVPALLTEEAEAHRRGGSAAIRSPAPAEDGRSARDRH